MNGEGWKCKCAVHGELPPHPSLRFDVGESLPAPSPLDPCPISFQARASMQAAIAQSTARPAATRAGLTASAPRVRSDSTINAMWGHERP